MFSKQNRREGHLIVGYTTQQHLLLDLDKSTLKQAIGITRHIQQSWPEVGDALILESSPPHKPDRTHYQHYGSYVKIPLKPNHHVVFDGLIGYKKCVDIIVTLVDLNILPEEYRNIREWRGDMTLRVSPKPFTDRTIPIPKSMWYERSKQAYAKPYGIYRYHQVHSATQSLFAADPEAETETDQSSDGANDSTQSDPILLED